MKADWMQTGNYGWCFEVQADAFLYRMVRRLVFAQVAAAQGKVSAEKIAYALVNPAKVGARKEVPPGVAPPHGLTLVEVKYDESIGQ
jgi:tRNA pseudouridine38-40 synthase